MSEYRVYNTSDEFLEEFVDPEDRAEVRAAASRMSEEHREASDRHNRIIEARTTAVRKSQVRQATAIATRPSRVRQARNSAYGVAARQAASSKITRSVLKTAGGMTHLIGQFVRMVYDMQRTRTK